MATNLLISIRTQNTLLLLSDSINSSSWRFRAFSFSKRVFPVLSSALYRDEIIRSILRPEAGDVPFDKFVLVMISACVCNLSSRAWPRTVEWLSTCHMMRRVAKVRRRKLAEGTLSAFGLKETKNSKDLVEAAFEGDLDIKALVEKGYHIDSEDRGHTAL